MDRNKQIYIDHLNGLTVRQLARKYDLGQQTISCILSKARQDYPRLTIAESWGQLISSKW